MNRKAFLGLLAVFVAVNLYAETAAIDMQGKTAAGLNYPGISARYGLTPKLVLEAKYQGAEGVSVFGPRVYYLLSRISERITSYTGGEFDMVTFKGGSSEGSGLVIAGFLGGEYYINNELSLQMDAGPAFITLTDSRYAVSQTGIEFVLNIGINYYFKMRS